MMKKSRNLQPEIPLPVDIVLAPAWWHKHFSIIFDKDFFFHPVKRVEVERKMEQILYERWGKYGLGKHRNDFRPEVGAVHLAAGFLISEMLGCQVDYQENSPPLVIPACRDELIINEEAAFRSKPFQSFVQLVDKLKEKYGYLTGDINWGGILNIALDLRGQELFMDMMEKPQEILSSFWQIASVIYHLVTGIQQQTGTSSISVNRNLIHLNRPVFLHSECSHTMISVNHYEKFLQLFDIEWSRMQRPFGIHYCGKDPHRYAESFAKLPRLDFLDVGWGGDIKILRKYLPMTFLNIRLSPVEIIHQSVDQIRSVIKKLVTDSGNPWLTGICCINMDDQVTDEKITAIFETTMELRTELVLD